MRRKIALSLLVLSGIFMIHAAMVDYRVTGAEHLWNFMQPELMLDVWLQIQVQNFLFFLGSSMTIIGVWEIFRGIRLGPVAQTASPSYALAKTK